MAVLLASSVPAVADPAPPTECGASVTIADGEKADKVQIVGTVKSATAKPTEPNRFEIVVADGKTERRFGLYIAPARLPFKAGNKIDASLRRGGGWHRVYDALIKDASGKVLLITSGSGADDWADGWKVTTGKVVESRQDSNQTAKSINRTHALDFARGKTTVTVSPRRCTVIKDGTARYLVSGFGNSWDGLRPPEGVDYQTFAMIPW